MNKKVSIKGFGNQSIDDEVNQSVPESVESIEESLVALIFDQYAPAVSFTESTDQKSTLDLIDEMESTSDVSKNKVVMAMDAAGFKLHYNGSEYVWLLKEK